MVDRHGPRVTARSHTHMSRRCHRDPMIVQGWVVEAPVACYPCWCHRRGQNPGSVSFPRPVCFALYPGQGVMQSAASG